MGGVSEMASKKRVAQTEYEIVNIYINEDPQKRQEALEKNLLKAALLLRERKKEKKLI